MLQWKLLYLAKQRKLFFSEEENINGKVNVRIETGKKSHAELLAEVCETSGIITHDIQHYNMFVLYVIRVN